MKRYRSDGSWVALWREALRAINLGWELALPIFGGVLAGHFLDRWLQTGYVFTLGLLMMGITAGFYNIWRFIQRLEARERELQKQQKAQKDKEAP